MFASDYLEIKKLGEGNGASHFWQMHLGYCFLQKEWPQTEAPSLGCTEPRAPLSRILFPAAEREANGARGERKVVIPLAAFRPERLRSIENGNGRIYRSEGAIYYKNKK